MPVYINERASESKKFCILLVNNNSNVYVIKKQDVNFNATFSLPNFNIIAFNGTSADDTKKFLTKALEFARKNIIIK